MAKCDYHRICGTRSVCYGIKNVEECSCGGDTCKCDFYPEKRSVNPAEKGKKMTDSEKIVLIKEMITDFWESSNVNEDSAITLLNAITVVANHERKD